ncbi:Uncharacterized protein TCM_017821 [Theobroma cacao]|uniref:Uncharacterized protein n=1 Tax=Theobroma cacao TaxID=3641 RepID=A0A061EFR1_THECC|nr:Uncharacterized protein TCM_017821 [Theobroma cacao]
MVQLICGRCGKAFFPALQCRTLRSVSSLGLNYLVDNELCYVNNVDNLFMVSHIVLSPEYWCILILRLWWMDYRNIGIGCVSNYRCLTL